MENSLMKKYRKFIRDKKSCKFSLRKTFLSQSKAKQYAIHGGYLAYRIIKGGNEFGLYAKGRRLNG